MMTDAKNCTRLLFVGMRCVVAEFWYAAPTGICAVLETSLCVSLKSLLRTLRFLFFQLKMVLY